MKRIKLVLSAICIVLFSQVTSYAWDGIVSGKISNIAVTSGANYGFRVTLTGSPVVCNGNTWGYLLNSDSNYTTYVAALLSANVGNLSVTLYTDKDLSSGYCHITYLDVQ